uniref:Bm13299 n=1 Tax=Brugia malayi TaxID=6279 RepID=A0A1I9G4R7_BRUMA|nr:Bm13299 [Brugia malayi]
MIAFDIHRNVTFHTNSAFSWSYTSFYFDKIKKICFLIFTRNYL